MDLNLNSLLTTGIAFSAITYIGYQLKEVPMYLWRQIKRRITYKIQINETDELYNYFERWLLDTYSGKYRNVEVSLSPKLRNGGSEFYYDKTENDKLYFWQNDDIFTIKNKGRYILIDKNKDKLEGAKDLLNMYMNSFSISGIFAKKSILDLLENVIDYNQKFKEIKLPRIYVSSSFGDFQHMGDINNKDTNSVFFNGKDELLKDIDSFNVNEEWYNKRGIPYKRGYLFYGLPGNGKTSTIQAIAKHYKKDVYYINLNDINKDFNLIWCYSQIPSGSIIVYEDIDTFFKDRNDSDNSELSFSTILNCLDGSYSPKGTLTFLTTNHIEKLDSALIRQGRVDMRIEITNPSKIFISNYIKNFFDTDQDIDLSLYEEGKLAMVNIQDICILNKDSLDNVLKEIIK